MGGIRVGALFLLATLFSLTVHEYAHAWVATYLGDSTPEKQGRLTLSPLPHIDPIGTIVLPILAAVFGVPVFGWARPVEFNPANFTRKVTMWQGTALTAAAGPLSNLLLAVVAALALRFIPFRSLGIPQFLLILLDLNVLLAIFNLLPLPPLDGGHFFPRSLAGVRDFLARWSFIILILMMTTGLGALILRPIHRAIGVPLLALAGVV